MDTPSPSSSSAFSKSPGFLRMFAPGKLTLGVFFPIAAYPGDLPPLAGQAELASAADSGGFAALWTRDIPLRDPNFGDTGQLLDIWVWMTYMLSFIKKASIATGSLILPLRHPVHIAKAAASLDLLSEGRLVLGLASGDRPVEFPAFGIDIQTVGARFQEGFHYLDTLLTQSFPHIQSALGSLAGADLVPKPLYGRIPLGITGGSRQPIEWTAQYADFWITYPRDVLFQNQVVSRWREALEQVGATEEKPVAQSLYIDLTEDPSTPAAPIHLGFRLGRYRLIELLERLQKININHVAFNLKFSRRPVHEVIDELSKEVVPLFPSL